MANLRIVEAVLRIEDGKHSLVESAEKFSQRILQVDLAVIIIVLEVTKEVYEDIRVSLIDDAVSLVEELVKF